MKHISHNKLFQILVVVSSMLLLAACGGGGGSSGGGSSVAPVRSLTGNAGSNTAATNTAVRGAATAIPKQGSVTQSSNRDGSDITEDEVQAVATYSGSNLRVEITNSRSGGFGNINSDDTLERSNSLIGTNTGNTYQERWLSKQIGDNELHVDVFTNRLSASDTDYIAGGVWVLGNEANPSQLEIGAFMDGPDSYRTSTAYLTTSANATYVGDATGIYAGVDNGDALLGEFVGDVALSATFGGSPTVSGSINNIQEIDISRTQLIDIGSPTLNLGSASVTTAAAGGFFTGDTSSTVMLGGASRTFAGKWGGQFYGTAADVVGGTFGGSTATGGSYELHFVGAFVADKE